MRRNTITTAAIGTITALALLTGCSSGGDGGAEATGKKLSDEQVAALGDVTLTISSWASGGQKDALERAITAFEKKYDNVTVEASYKSFDDYGKTIDLTMQSNSAPDIAQSNAVMARRLTAGKLIRPLDEYATSYSWADRYPAAVKGMLTVSEDGKIFGTGHQWGAAPGGNIVGVFYNTKILADLGLPVPSDYDAFIASMDAAKKAGVQPIVMGNLEQWPANHLLSAVLNYTAGPKQVQDWINGAGGSFADAGFVDGLSELQKWMKAGYISPDTNGIKNDDGNAAFVKGEGLYQITGNWNTGLYADMGADAGYFVLPAPAGKEPATTGAFDGALTISGKSKQPDLAALFLDFYTGQEMAASNLEGGYLPFSP
ncbi:MAG: extracellular solute-binding protein, partial [Microbacterium sp.]